MKLARPLITALVILSSFGANAELVFPKTSKTPFKIQKLAEKAVKDTCPGMFGGNELRVSSERKIIWDRETTYFIQVKGFTNGLGDPTYHLEIEIEKLGHSNAFEEVFVRNLGDCF